MSSTPPCAECRPIINVCVGLYGMVVATCVHSRYYGRTVSHVRAACATTSLVASRRPRSNHIGPSHQPEMTVIPVVYLLSPLRAIAALQAQYNILPGYAHGGRSMIFVRPLHSSFRFVSGDIINVLGINRYRLRLKAQIVPIYNTVQFRRCGIFFGYAQPMKINYFIKFSR